MTSSPEKSKNSSNPNTDPGLLGKPDCPLCGGSGYLRQDLPVGHPDFGKITICDCRRPSVTEQIRNRLFSFSRLDELKELTFETFQPRGRTGLAERHANSLEWSFNHARQYAQDLRGWFLMQGSYGCGKTHLAAAIANYSVQMGVPTLFLTVPDLLDSLRFAYDHTDTSFEERFDQIRSADLLVLDDFGTQNTTAWAQEKLFQIINFRYINKLPLVVTTNMTIEDIDPRIRSRLQDPELVSILKINAPDYRRPITEIKQSELSTLDLLADKKFTNFSLRQHEDLKPDEIKSLEHALKEAKTFADNPHGWLVLTGPYGSGKTHLGAAIANYCAENGEPPMVVLVPDLLDHLRATYNPNSGVSYDRRFEDFRVASLLVLDDLGSQSSTPWAKEKLYQLLNYRYNSNLPTVITVAVEMLKDVDERILTRLRDERISNIVTITAPAFVGSKKKNPRSRRV